jgi:hypothetical protein
LFSPWRRTLFIHTYVGIHFLYTRSENTYCACRILQPGSFTRVLLPRCF